jgi:hypothetical protein
VILNCTIADNGGYGVVRWGTGVVTITDSILWGNGDDLDGDPAGLAVSFCDIGDGDFAGSDGNITADPLFTPGPLHGYYLGQVAAGQAGDSPCVDAGSNTAEAIGLDTLSTRTDGMSDTGQVDTGYHAVYVLRIGSIGFNSDDVTIEWNARAGVSYVVEWSDDRAAWNAVAVGETGSWTDTSAAGTSSRYYRVREE